MFEKLRLGLIIGYFAILITMFAGWVNNIIWIFNHINDSITAHFILACIGVIAAPLGVIHGIWLWF